MNEEDLSLRHQEHKGHKVYEKNSTAPRLDHIRNLLTRPLMRTEIQLDFPRFFGQQFKPHR